MQLLQNLFMKEVMLLNAIDEENVRKGAVPRESEGLRLWNGRFCYKLKDSPDFLFVKF
jgi:hypothetical protein